MAIDGKSLRGSKRANECKKALPIVNAWSCANRIGLGQLKVTFDAMGAEEEAVKQIREADADYVITL